jgi:threonine dehydrogenase-like Zn-dependent dehydrogenase
MQAMISAAGNGGKGAEAYIDFSSNAATKQTHIASAMAALRPFGKASFMGGIFGNIEVNYISLMMRSLRIQGSFMYGQRSGGEKGQNDRKGESKIGC